MSNTAHEIAEQIVYRPDPNTSTSRLIEAAVLEAVMAEREACALACEEFADKMGRPWALGARRSAKRIRERGE